MKPITIHPLSALAGVAGLVLVALATSAAQVSSPAQFLASNGGPLSVRVLGVPTAQQMVRIRGGTPFVVPQGKLLVLTGLGMGSTGTSELRIDGQLEVAAGNYSPSEQYSSVVALPPGLAAGSGSTVEVVVTYGQATGRAWGYLVDQ